jgi:hypothetical protein
MAIQAFYLLFHFFATNAAIVYYLLKIKILMWILCILLMFNARISNIQNFLLLSSSNLIVQFC